MRGKTIQVFLTDGSPRGIKINEASTRPEVANPGVYFLFGESDTSHCQGSWHTKRFLHSCATNAGEGMRMDGTNGKRKTLDELKRK